MTLLGGVSVAVLVAVFLSNLPEAFAATATCARAQRALDHRALDRDRPDQRARVADALLDGASARVSAFVLAFAGGAILTMLADTMMPEAFTNGGKLGVVTSVGSRSPS